MNKNEALLYFCGLTDLQDWSDLSSLQTSMRGTSSGKNMETHVQCILTNVAHVVVLSSLRKMPCKKLKSAH